jgi:hypothetical protein
MDLIAAKIVLDSACGQDIRAQNPIALQALTGLQNYLLYYGASCLKDPTTNIYCTFMLLTFINNRLYPCHHQFHESCGRSDVLPSHDSHPIRRKTKLFVLYPTTLQFLLHILEQQHLGNQ